MKRIVTTTILLALLPSQVLAGTTNGYNTDVSSQHLKNNQDNETSQENVAAINQTSVYSVGQASTYRIDSVVCPRPAAVISGATSGGDNFNSSYSVSGSLVIPLGGDVGKLCESAFAARTEHYLIQNEVNVSRECSQIVAAGLNLNAEQFPVLSKYCAGVSARVSVPSPPPIEVTPTRIKEPTKQTKCDIHARFTEELTGKETSCPLSNEE